MKRIYGKPTEQGKPYVAELYCGMCNQVPVETLWQGDKVQGTYIGDLFPIHRQRINLGGKMETEELMICYACVQKIEEKMRAKIMEIFKRRKPPEDPSGGALPHSPTPA